MADVNLKENTINVINQLEYTRTNAPTAVANGLGIIHSSIYSFLQSGVQFFDPAYKMLGFVGSFIAVNFTSGAYCAYSEANAQGVTVWNAIEALCQMETPPSTFIECVSSSMDYPCWFMGAAGLALLGYHFKNWLPVIPANYNIGLGIYNANYFNSVHTKASSYFNKIDNFLTKNICFENGANVSVEELDNLYLGFHLFCHPINNNGFDINDTSHHDAFLNFIAKNNKFDNLLTLVRLGASKQDCENKVAVQTVKTTGLNEKDFPVNKSLTWLAAKAVSAQYADKDLELNETQSKIVRESRKYEKFTF